MTASPAMRVVVIDDTPDLRDLLRMVLEIGGFDVVAEAGDGREGIEVVRAHRPELILLDLAMPVMDGLEALPALRQLCPTAKILVLSGFDATQMTGRALRAGADGYVQKGAALPVLLERLHELTGVEPPPDEAADDAGAEATAAEVTAAAHGLRGPVGVIAGLVDALLDEETRLGDREQETLLKAVARQTGLLDATAADLLHDAAARQRRRRAGASPADLLRDLVAGDGEARLEVEDPRSPAVDPARLELMLGNLLTNARQHGRPPYVVRVHDAADQSYVSVSVADHGPGVEPELVARLFAEHDGASADGSGLGLFVVRRLVEAAGGRVDYRPGEPGAVFTLTLPATG